MYSEDDTCNEKENYEWKSRRQSFSLSVEYNVRIHPAETHFSASFTWGMTINSTYRYGDSLCAFGVCTRLSIFFSFQGDPLEKE